MQWGVPEIHKRIWIRSGIVEELDASQQRLLEHVLGKIRYYYREVHGTKPCHLYPLTLTRLRRLCNRSSNSVLNAVRILANTVSYGIDEEPIIYYDRVKSEKNSSHRPYRIFICEKHYERWRRLSEGCHILVRAGTRFILAIKSSYVGYRNWTALPFWTIPQL